LALVPGTRLGGYEITALLGAGGMGEVYRATDLKLKRDVAMKVVPPELAGDPERLERFQREAELLASLNHPNIAHVHGLEESGGTTALVMELVEGDDLSQRIERGPTPVHEALAMAQQIASALEAAHEQGIIHRDLKPGNIKVRADGTVKVLDFGLARSLARAGADVATRTSISSPGMVVGTPAYMSPEQARGEPTGRETDVWAFGVVLYEMLTGISPFARKSASETLVQVLTAPLDESRLPSSTPGSLRRLIRRCLERDPKRRWHHIGDARIEIEEALATPADTLSPASAAGAAAVTRRHALAFGAASLALLTSGLGGGMWLGRRARPPLAPSFRRLTFRRGLIRSARFAPDGETILYGALWDNDRCRVHTVRIDGPESRALDLPEANLLAISRTGDLALALGPHENGVITYGTLARVPIAGGAPRQILEGVRFADWSPDGADLAIIRRADGGDQLEYPIGKVLVGADTGQGTGLGFARISPDGTRVAFVHYANPGAINGRVSIVDQAGTITPVSTDYLNIHGLAWKGSEILYTAADERPLYRALHSVTPGGSTRIITRVPSNITLWDALPDGRLLTAQTDDRAVLIARFGGDDRDRDLSWLDASLLADLSRDGRLLLFTEYGQGGGPDSAVYLRNSDGSAAVRLGAGRAVALSPDTQWAVCFPSDIAPGPYLDVLPTGPGEPRRVPGNGLRFTGAQWLPDGKRLVISALEGNGRPRLFLHDLGPDPPTAITPEGINAWAVAPNGSAVAARGPGRTIRLYTLDGSERGEVPGLTGVEVPVGWITDGLLVMRSGDATSPLGQIYRIDLATGHQEPWKNILPRDRAGVMAQMSFSVTPDGQSQAYTWHRALSSLYLADGLE
jgi:eukaryotic-like serine/threonine-protein kinase